MALTCNNTWLDKPSRFAVALSILLTGFLILHATLNALGPSIDKLVDDALDSAISTFPEQLELRKARIVPQCESGRSPGVPLPPFVNRKAQLESQLAMEELNDKIRRYPADVDCMNCEPGGCFL